MLIFLYLVLLQSSLLQDIVLMIVLLYLIEFEKILRKYKKLELADLFNLSINNTLSRTVMTSLTTFIA